MAEKTTVYLVLTKLAITGHHQQSQQLIITKQHLVKYALK